MARKSSKQRIVTVQIFLLSAAVIFTQGSIAQSGQPAVTIVQSADRVPLYPDNGHPDNRNFVYPNIIRKNGSLTIFATRQFDVLEMVNGNGVLVFQENIKGRTGRFDIPLKPASTGINYVRLRNKETMLIQKVLIVE